MDFIFGKDYNNNIQISAKNLENALKYLLPFTGKAKEPHLPENKPEPKADFSNKHTGNEPPDEIPF